MYGNHVYINASVVEKAIRLCVKLEIKVPAGTAIVDPLEWKNKKDWMKKVFKFKDRPMLLYGGNVPVAMPKSVTQGGITYDGKLSKAEQKRLEKREKEKMIASLPKLF